MLFQRFVEFIVGGVFNVSAYGFAVLLEGE